MAYFMVDLRVIDWGPPTSIFGKQKKKKYYDRSKETLSITIGESLSVTPVSKNNEIPYALFTLQPQGTSTLPHHPLQKSAGSTPGTYLHRKRNWRVLRSLFISIGFCSALRSLSFWSVTQILDALRYRWWLRTVWGTIRPSVSKDVQSVLE